MLGQEMKARYTCKRVAVEKTRAEVGGWVGWGAETLLRESETREQSHRGDGLWIATIPGALHGFRDTPVAGSLVQIGCHRPRGEILQPLWLMHVTFVAVRDNFWTDTN